MKRLLITGIGRSGTGYTAALFEEMGVPSGHEEVYGEDRARPWRKPVEASWYAPAYVEPGPGLGRGRLPMFVVHQVRHPLRWLASWLDVMPYHTVLFAARHAGIADALPLDLAAARSWWERAPEPCPKLRAALMIWVAWQRKCERIADVRFRVEDIDASALRTMATCAGIKGVDEHRSAYALRRINKDVNSRKTPRRIVSGDRKLGWQDIPACEEREPFVALANKYGYDAA